MNKILFFLLITWTSYSFCSWLNEQEQEKINLALKNHKALMVAIKKGDLDQIQSIAKEDAYINQVLPPYNETPLTDAVNYGRLDIVKLLLEKGVDINTKNLDGDTALNNALFNDNNEMVKLLLNSNADINTKDIEGNTALTYVQQPDMIDLLKKYHANPNIRNKKKQNAITSHIIHMLDSATDNPDPDIIKSMLEAGVKINNQDIFGNTALFYASHQYSHIVALLLNSGADFKIKNKKGQTALDMAFKYYFKYMTSGKHLIKDQKSIILMLLNKYYESYLNYYPQVAKTINEALLQLPTALGYLISEYKSNFFVYLEEQLGKPLPNNYIPTINEFLETKIKRKSTTPSSQTAKKQKLNDDDAMVDD